MIIQMVYQKRTITKTQIIPVTKILVIYWI